MLQSHLPHLNALVSPSAPPNFAISSSDATFLSQILNSELQRHRALVDISLLSKSTSDEKSAAHAAPLVESLDKYPLGGAVDLSRLVQYPPKIEVVPIKPLFFDVAWNYIGYPGRKVQPQVVEQVRTQVVQEEERPTSSSGKKSWFGFGRS